MNIRKSEAKDWQKIRDLNNETFKINKGMDKYINSDFPFEEKGETHYKKVASWDYGYCYVYEVDGEIVGYVAMGDAGALHRQGKQLNLEHMVVDKEYQSKGIGTELVQKCFDFAKENGYDRIYVNEYIANQKAINFFRLHGFTDLDLGLQVDIK